MVDCNCEIANERCNSNSSTSTSLQYDKATLDGSQYDKAALDGSLLAFSARLFPLARRLLSLVCASVCVGCGCGRCCVCPLHVFSRGDTVPRPLRKECVCQWFSQRHHMLYLRSLTVCGVCSHISYQVLKKQIPVRIWRSADSHTSSRAGCLYADVC